MEQRLALFDERPGRLAVILGQTRPRLVPGLEIEQLGERATLGGVHVAFNVAVGDPRPAGETPGQAEGLRFELRVRYHAVDEPDRERARRVEQLGREVELARAGGAHQARQEVGAAEVARVADPREGGGELRRVRRDAEVAGQSQRETSIRARSCCARSSSEPPAPSVPSAIALTSPPAQKARPAPVSTTAPISGAPARRASAASIASSIGRDIAFSRSGRFIVRIATPSFTCSRKSIASPPGPRLLARALNCSESVRPGATVRIVP